MARERGSTSHAPEHSEQVSSDSFFVCTVAWSHKTRLYDWWTCVRVLNVWGCTVNIKADLIFRHLCEINSIYLQSFFLCKHLPMQHIFPIWLRASVFHQHRVFFWCVSEPVENCLIHLVISGFTIFTKVFILFKCWWMWLQTFSKQTWQSAMNFSGFSTWSPEMSSPLAVPAV